MRIFWKIYLVSLGLLVTSVALVTVAVSARQARRSLADLRATQRLHAQVAATQVEAGYYEQVWPFEMLAALAADSNYVFWQILDGNGESVLACATAPSEEQRLPSGFSPDLARTGPVLLKGPGPDTEVWVVPLRMRTDDRPWTFHLAFHTRAIREQTQGIIRTNVLFALLIAVVLVPASLLATRRLVRPLESLAAAAGEMERGNLGVTLPAAGNDEVGRLVVAFDAMTKAIRARDAEIQEKVRALGKARDELEVRVAERTGELRSASGELTREVAVRRGIEEHLCRSERLNLSLVEQLPQRVFVKDLNSVYVSCNANYARDLGTEPEQIVGKDDFAFYPRELADMYRADDRAVMDAGSLKDIEEKYLVSGEERYVHTIKVPYRDGHGHVVGVLGIFEDITERKQLQEELRASRDLLEQRVQERTTELVQANQQLRQAQVELVQSEKMGMLGQLVAGVAHEINTPTGAILNVMNDGDEHMRAFLAAERDVCQLPDEVRHWVMQTCNRLLESCPARSEPATRALRREVEKELHQGGHRQYRRMAAVITAGFAENWRQQPDLIGHLSQPAVLDALEHLLAMRSANEITLASAQKVARIVRALRYYSHTGKDELTDVNVNESLDNTLVILQNRIKHVAVVKTDFAADLPPVRSGPDLSQVWTNILNNACDAIEGAGKDQKGLVEVATALAGDKVVVRIADDGTPIPQDVLPKMFDPFFTTKPVGKGTGLGLSICTAILRRCGGSISARNLPGRVVFEVSLPAAPRAVDAPEGQGGAQAQPAETPT